MQGDLLVLRQLIAGGADVDTRDEGGTTPAMFAANRGYMELVQALIEAGCDVLVEKPIAAEVDEGRRLTDFAERHKRILQVGHVERYNPAIMAVSCGVSEAERSNHRLDSSSRTNRRQSPRRQFSARLR